MHAVRISIVVSLLAFLGCALANPAPGDVAALQEWRAKRLANLTSESGWLTLVGLYWLKEGENTFGRAASNSIVLDHADLSDSVGSFVRTGDAVQFIAKPGSNVTHDGKSIASLPLLSDKAGKATILAAGSLRFFVIERAGRIGVRVRDIEHPARVQFKGLQHFPVRTDWIVEARFEPYQPVKRVPILNVLGMTDAMESPGALVFEKDGKQWRLDALREAPDARELFIIFVDATSPRESYGAGRYMYVPLPQDGRVRVDFNRAYNPPCAFNEFATCPLPPQQNRLALRIEAGEKKYASH